MTPTDDIRRALGAIFFRLALKAHPIRDNLDAELHLAVTQALVREALERVKAEGAGADDPDVAFGEKMDQAITAFRTGDKTDTRQ